MVRPGRLVSNFHQLRTIPGNAQATPEPKKWTSGAKKKPLPAGRFYSCGLKWSLCWALMPSPQPPIRNFQEFFFKDLFSTCLLSTFAQPCSKTMFLFVFSSLFPGIREAEYNPFQISHPVCLQIPFSPRRRRQLQLRYTWPTLVGSNRCLFITFGMNSLSCLRSSGQKR